MSAEELEGLYPCSMGADGMWVCTVLLRGHVLATYSAPTKTVARY